MYCIKETREPLQQEVRTAAAPGFVVEKAELRYVVEIGSRVGLLRFVDIYFICISLALTFSTSILDSRMVMRMLISMGTHRYMKFSMLRAEPA